MGVKQELEARIGKTTEPGEWHTVTQADVERFADATRDRQWIHVDEQRAARGPFGGTIAHGFMTLALIPGIGPRSAPPPGVRMTVNYGLERVRFVSPVLVGSRVRVRSELIEVTETPKGFKLKEKVTVELEGSVRPACVAETLILLVP